MANELAKIEDNSGMLSMTENEIIDVLQSSLYPGAQMKSIKMVLGYCKAASLDPMTKPVHIVPMWDKNVNAMRDVIMPGVGLYRTQASRSGQLAGISEPEFGSMVVQEFNNFKMLVPEWCRVVVKRLLPNGTIGEFSAIEYWIENYATAKKDTDIPNAMWKKRPRGQLAKCAQAQALRMAFPEMTGSMPTADEMEGKQLEAGEIDITPTTDERPPKEEKKMAEYTEDQFNTNKEGWKKMIDSGAKTSDRIIAMVSTKFILSEKHRKEISSWKKIEDEIGDAQEYDGAEGDNNENA